MVKKFDFLVIGSGLAGMSFALKVAHKGKVALICKAGLEEANTYFAQGGIASVTNLKVDNFEKHIEDTMIAGDWISDRAAVEKVVREAPAQIQELIKWGVDFDKKEDGEFDLHKEGGHSEFRILHHKDNTGAEIQTSLIEAVKAHPNITIFTDHYAVEIITQHHLGIIVTRHTPGIKCFGAYVLNEKTGEVDTFLSKVKDGCFTTRFCRLSNGYSVATTLSGGKEFFILFDRDFKEIKRFGNHPVRGMTTEANDFMQLQGEMVSYKNSFYFASRFFGYLCRYDISDEEDVTLKWEKMLVEPVCNVYEANLARKKNNLDGFYGLTANDKYVFVTYSGELCYKAFENYSACTPKTLLGFSIDGELVGKYALEHQSMSVLLSQYTPQLYLLNCESECNVEIFEMDDILKAKL